MRLAAALAFACMSAACGARKDAGGDKASASGGSGAATASGAVDAAAAAATADAGAKAAPAPISKETRATYKRHLSAGRKAAKAAKWPEAMKELEAALVAIPGDDRALGELSWAAFSAGDHARARKTGRASVAGATDPKIKAASLYNLGRVEEATGKITEAAALYRQSIALRPNKTVETRLAALPKDAAAVASGPSPCEKPMPEDDVCTCLEASAAEYREDADADTKACDLEPAGIDGFQIASYTLTSENEVQHVLVARQPKGWAVVADLAYVYNPGMMGISEEWSMEPPKEETIGGKQVVRFVHKKARSDSDMGIDEVESEDTETLVVCVRGGASADTTCPIDVITSYTYLRESLGMADDEDLSDVADLRTKGLPIRSDMRVSVTIGPDGVAKVRADRGRAETSQLGDHKLW
ncbi:MAG TPA: tetratricopeptide repeat protein [Kofleriaceae bacterium]|nr:tetratricopeptide repeat protein [Kofleriaceae bacterium]